VVCQDGRVTIAPTQPVAPRQAKSRTNRWIIAITAAWIAVLAAAGIYAARGGTVTDRTQTTVAEARPYVDEAVARIALAATEGDQAVVAISAFERVGECDVTTFRGGERYRRNLTALVEPGSEEAFLQRVAGSLPAGYRAAVRTGAAPRLTADAGLYVSVAATVIRPGEVRFVADTSDCRVPGDDLVTTDSTGEGGPRRATIEGVLTTLALTATGWSATSVPCPDGGAVRTVQATAGPYQGDLTASLAGTPPDAVIVASGSQAYAYRSNLIVVGVRALEESTTVSATTVCL
jgi:hypothetical protein